MMKRRLFLGRIAALFGAGIVAAPASAGLRRITELQRSPVAGFQYHRGEAVWAQLTAGSSVDLVREPDNRHDSRAVRVDWNGHTLGYIPRVDNAAICHLLDSGKQVSAEIAALRLSTNPWHRIELAVSLLD